MRLNSPFSQTALTSPRKHTCDADDVSPVLCFFIIAEFQRNDCWMRLAPQFARDTTGVYREARRGSFRQSSASSHPCRRRMKRPALQL
jgi:hypothetical protein